MKLSNLEKLNSFALVAPCFGQTKQFQLLTPLQKITASQFTKKSQNEKHQRVLTLVDYESAGEQAQCYQATAIFISDLEFDVAFSKINPFLESTNYACNVERIRETISRGDVYQVNYTIRAELPDIDGCQLFSQLCARGIPRFAAWVRLPGGEEIVSASPELFFEIENHRIRAEPMKGTAAPSSEKILKLSEKDQAELAMITDLIRNDLTPICIPKTVRVTCERRFLTLPYAVQAVSEIQGCLLPHITPLQVLSALHPGGSVTGAPKKAAMEMIRHLESGNRGFYCGALGIQENSRSVYSLLIRTASRRQSEGWVYGVGGGIVFDSSASQEWEEIELKLGALKGW